MNPDRDDAPRAATMRVLLIEREPGDPAAVAEGLAQCFAHAPELELARGGRAGAELLRTRPRDLVLADVASLADLADAAEEAVARLAKLAGEALTVVLSDDGSVSAAVAAMRAGAHDCLAKPVEPEVLAGRISVLAARHGKALDLRAMPGDTAPAIAASAPGGAGRQPVLPMWRQEQRIIEDAIASFAGNIAMAAAALELSPSTIYRKRQAWAESDQERRGAA